MTHTMLMLMEVLGLKLAGLPPTVWRHQLDEHAEKLMHDFSALVDAKAISQHSVLTHKFRLTV